MKPFLAAVFFAISTNSLFAGWVWPWQGNDLQQQVKQAQDKAADAAQRADSTEAVLVIAVILLILLGFLAWYFYAHRTVIKEVLTQQVVQNVIKKEVVVRSPAHSITHDSYVIDGTNVIRSFAPYQAPSIAILLTLLLAIRQRGWTFKCYFDNSTFHVFRDAKLKGPSRLYEDLCREFPDCFIEVPTGNRADDFILDYAHSHGTPIISNDRFRDYATTYSWIQSDPERRISGVCHSGIVQIIPLGIEAPLVGDLASAVTSLRNSFLSTHETPSAWPRAERGDVRCFLSLTTNFRFCEVGG